jgi:tetratricopeptide (TPR) repeat protein
LCSPNYYFKVKVKVKVNVKVNVNVKKDFFMGIDKAGAFFDKGTEYLTAENHDKAIAYFTVAIDMAGDDDHSGLNLSESLIKCYFYLYRSFAYYRAGIGAEKAVADIGKAIGLGDAGGFLDKIIEWSSSSNSENSDYAIIVCGELIRLVPGLNDELMAKCLFSRGRAFYNRGIKDPALEDFTEAIRRFKPDPSGPAASPGDDPFADLLNTVFYEYSSDSDFYIALFTALAKVEFGAGLKARCFFYRGRAYLQCTHNWDLAGVGPNLAGIAREDCDKALADFTEAIRLDPLLNDANCFALRGEIYLSRKEYDSAIADFATALRIDPGYTRIREILGRAQKERDGAP